MTLKERIARAIYAEQVNQWDIQADEAEIVRMKCCAYDDCDWQEKREYEAFAQAALEAMISLTPVMQEAVEAMLDKEGMYMDPSISDVWETCIKAAIAER